jgi:sugar porter (SP) family MFS transporter
LIQRGRRDEGERVLSRVRSQSEVSTEVEEIVGEASKGVKTWHELLKPALFPALIVGVGLMMFQQITGINTVIYFAPSIFKMSGFASSSVAILATLGVGLVNVFFTVVSLFLIDRWGRKPLLYVGLVGEGISLTVLGLSFLSPADTSWIALISVGVYVASFAISLGPIAWLVIAEIYPLDVRSAAMSYATVANWFFNFVVSLTFLSLVHGIGPSWTFWIYAIMCAAGIVFVYRMIPETKGKSLEEISARWK